MSSFGGFPRDTIEFLNDLHDNNTRSWFAENKTRYESSFLEPALALIRALEKPLGKAAPMLQVDARKSGGSLMRIYKDTRFSKDKTPYKTNMGIHLRHRAGKDVHAPGIYLHIAPEELFLGAGIWRPASEALAQIRTFIANNPTGWERMCKNKKLSAAFEFYDDRLKTAPRGIPKDHPQIDQLRLKSFLCMAKLKRSEIESQAFPDQVIALVKTAKPIMATLCEALAQPY